ncbi:MAG: acetyl-CoA carboxylase biotin carboxyl carrier protein, partial [Polaromonas sp.]|nr:acetyl-CoA carboxylase biotin carboxyl carrier protein [Polaromonas sp.]
MDLRKLKTLIDLVSESNVSELEITEAEGKVRIVKSGGAPQVMQQAAVAAPAPAAAPAVAAAPVVAEA